MNISSSAVRAIGCVLMGLLAGCNLLDTTSKEPTLGRGSQSFDPYTGNSGAARLELNWLHGCSMLANGTPVAKGEANIPYPDTCANLRTSGLDPLGPSGPPDPMAPPPDAPITPTGTMTLVQNHPYFINDLTFLDEAVNAHTDPADMQAVVRWFSNDSMFKGLDWTNTSVLKEDWYNIDLGAGPGTWAREVSFANANWMNSTDDHFTVEVLDKAGTVRSTTTYNRTDFLTESSTAGHSRISWRVEGVAPPNFPGDIEPHPSPLLGGAPPTFRTVARIDMSGSTNPFNTFKATELGDGAIRVTWSLMPDAPFYFPVKVIDPNAAPATCYPADGGTTLVQCGFGLDPQIHFSEPQNGSFYQPGEPFDLLLSLKDANGNLLHDPQFLPSGADFFGGNSNGIIYSPAWETYTFERDATSAFQVAGPIDRLVPADPSQDTPWTTIRREATLIDGAFATEQVVPDVFNSPWPTRRPIQLDPNAPAGTYVALLKAHREFNGERTSKLTAAFFQVGQAQPTSYPGRVGNCQICHRGVLSLDNLRHGLSVDHVEACKACHTQVFDDIGGQVKVEIHQIHFRSLKYPQPKNDCTICHLARESAVRPSISVCSSCHPSVHGDAYFPLQFAVNGEPNRWSNCAQTCHAKTPPVNHILPAN